VAPVITIVGVGVGIDHSWRDGPTSRYSGDLPNISI
jgi:hypothetical protein